MKRLALIALLCLLSGYFASAQSLWLSPEADFRITKGLSAGVEFDYRTLDGVSGSDRFAGTVSLEYKPIKYLKLTGGYSYIYKYTEAEWTSGGNWKEPYWNTRHRGFVAATGIFKTGRFTFSLRERYQYTHVNEITIKKYKSDDDTCKLKTDSEWNPKYELKTIDAKNKQVLRSRLKGEYNIRRSPFSPYISAEVYNDLTSNFAYNKTRVMIGSEIKIDKHNSFDLFLGYMNKADDDDLNGWIIGLGYSFKL